MHDQTRVQVWLQEMSLSEPYAEPLKNIGPQFTPSSLSKGMKSDVKCKHTCPIKTEGDHSNKIASAWVLNSEKS